MTIMSLKLVSAGYLEIHFAHHKSEPKESDFHGLKLWKVFNQKHIKTRRKQQQETAEWC